MPTRMNYTGDRSGNCPIHGKFIGRTSLAHRIPTCPKCINNEEQKQKKEVRKQLLEDIIKALKENGYEKAVIQEILSGTPDD